MPTHPARAAPNSPKPRPFFTCQVISVFVQDLSGRYSVGIQSSQSQVYFIVESPGLYFLRRTAVLILRPAIAGCPAGVGVKDFVDLEEHMTVPLLQAS